VDLNYSSYTVSCDQSDTNNIYYIESVCLYISLLILFVCLLSYQRFVWYTIKLYATFYYYICSREINELKNYRMRNATKRMQRPEMTDHLDGRQMSSTDDQ